MVTLLIVRLYLYSFLYFIYSSVLLGLLYTKFLEFTVCAVDRRCQAKPVKKRGNPLFSNSFV